MFSLCRFISSPERGFCRTWRQNLQRKASKDLSSFPLLSERSKTQSRAAKSAKTAKRERRTFFMKNLFAKYPQKQIEHQRENSARNQASSDWKIQRTSRFFPYKISRQLSKRNPYFLPKIGEHPCESQTDTKEYQ